MSENLRLFIKTGAPGSEPDGLYPALAAVHDSLMVSTDAVRLDMGQGRLIYNCEMNRAVTMTLQLCLAGRCPLANRNVNYSADYVFFVSVIELYYIGS